MDQLAWPTAEAAMTGLMDIECRIGGGQFFDAYLAQLQPNGQAQCTTVWTKTTVAYRCRTCQVNDSSAICVSCFQAGDHRDHDYVMYHSDSGGSCDCGDPAAWKQEGFCSNHRCGRPHQEPAVPSHLREVTCQAVEFVLRELSLWVQLVAEARMDGSDPSSSPAVQMAHTYVIWLQKLCSATGLRTILCEEMLRVRRDRSGQEARCCLDTYLSAYAKMPEGLMESETTLFLQMLYDQHFKDRFSRALMRHYAEMVLPAAVETGRLTDYQIVDRSLDRVMVQLFNVPEITLNLIQTDHLLECVTSVLGSILKHCTDEDTGTVKLNHPAIQGKVYSRPQGDVKLILGHDAVSLHVLKERPDFFQTMLSIWSMLQWMNPYRQSEGAQLQKLVWRNAITLELDIMAIGFGIVNHCFATFPFSGDMARSALVSAACLTMTSLRDFLSKEEFSKGSPETVSLHIPLHRIFCAIISKLVLMPWEDTNNGFLSVLHPAFDETEILALMEHPLRAAVWLAQIRAQMWRSTSEDLSGLEFIYRGSIWHAQSMDLDIFMLQFCSVARENMGQSVVLTMAKRFDLLDFVTIALDAGRLKDTLSSRRVSMIHDFLRLLLLVVRERRNTGMSKKETLRSDVIQWLCYRDHTHSEIKYCLSGLLFDQSNLDSVLNEVANYNDPKLQERGCYQLKPECWKDFDPMFAHYYLNHLEEAQERALSLGKISRYWRLKTPMAARPPFNRLNRLLHTQACQQLIWNVLYSVIILIRDEMTATSAEALGVMALQVLEMALNDFRAADSSQESAVPSQEWDGKSSTEHHSEVVQFLYSKPTINQGTSDWDHRDSLSPNPSVYEMLTHLRQVKDSLRLVDLVDYILQRLNVTPNSTGGLEKKISLPVQVLDAYTDDEQRKLKKQRQEAILANFAARQKAFLENVVNKDDSGAAQGVPSSLSENDAEETFDGDSRTPSSAPLKIKMFADKTGLDTYQHECAFCRCECDGKESATGWIAWVQRYSIPRLVHSRGQAVTDVKEFTNLMDPAYEIDGNWHPEMISVVSSSLEEETSCSGSLDLHPTEHVRCCGHQMHLTCFQRYADSLIRRHYARSPYEGKGIIDLATNDFLCPICRRLSNALLPDVNYVIPWNTVLAAKEKNRKGLVGRKYKAEEENFFFKLDDLLPDRSSVLHDMKYWKEYWHTRENFAEAVVLFVSQCLRVRNTFMKEPPDMDSFSLCQVLWEAFAENVIHCEVKTRDGPTLTDVASSSGSASSQDSVHWSGDATHWRAIVELGKLTMLTSTLPCVAKHQKRLLVLRWLGFDESVVEKLKSDGIRSTTKSDGQEEHYDQIETGDDVLESTRRAKGHQKSIEIPELAQANEGRWKEVSKEVRSKRSMPKVLGKDEKQVGSRKVLGDRDNGDVLEVADTTNIGWLWNNARSARLGDTGSSDAFELLIMLLFTLEGWPTVQDVLTMVRVTYMLAAAQASAALDKLVAGDSSSANLSSTLRNKVLEVSCLSFLRRAALLVRVIMECNVINHESGDEFLSMDSKCLQQWLNLPNVHDAVTLGRQGKGCANLQKLSSNNEVVPILYRSPRQALFIDLPKVFQELLLQTLHVACSHCGQKPREPVICLLCGVLVCFGTECCKVGGKGECYRHAEQESVGVGLFLMMRSTRLVLLRSNRAYIAPSLYLDLHGEEDEFLKRGHPLHLSRFRLNEIRRLWLTAAFDHDTHILHDSQLGGMAL